MNRRADEFARDVARQLCVGVERDDVTDVFQERVVRRVYDEARIAGAAEQPVELLEFAALAFPTHPTVLAGIPLTTTMEEVKTIVAMPAVERVYAALRDREQV